MNFGVLIFLLILDLSSFAFAGFRADYPVIRFPEPVSVENICTDGEHLRTVKPVRVCAQYRVVAKLACSFRGEAENCRLLRSGESPGGHEILKEQKVCSAFEARPLCRGRTYSEEECSEWSSVNSIGEKENRPYCVGPWVKRIKKIPLVYKVNSVVDGGEASGQPVGSFTYFIGSCPEGTVMSFDCQMFNK